MYVTLWSQLTYVKARASQQPFFTTKRGKVESECGAVALGQACVFPPLSFGGALVVQSWLRFHIPLMTMFLSYFRLRPSSITIARLVCCDAGWIFCNGS